MLASLVDLALALSLIPRLGVGDTHMLALNEHLPWLPDVGVSYTLSADGINLFLLGLNALLTLVAVGASFNVARNGDRPRQYLFLMMLFSFGMQGVFLATNLFLFYVFWEVMLVPAYLLLGMFGGPRRGYAAIKFVLYTSAGSLLMLVGIIATGIAVSGAHNTPYTLDLAALLNAGVPEHPQVILFLAFAAAFAVKTGLFPLHDWVPDAYSESPIPVVILIAGVMAKTGVYGFVRFCLPLFPQAVHTLTPLMETLAVVSILYFALQALVAQRLCTAAGLCQHQPPGRDRAGHLRAQRRGCRGRHRADGQPWHHHRRALPDRGRHRDAHGHAATGRRWRAGDETTVAGDGLPHLGAGGAWPAWPE